MAIIEADDNIDKANLARCAFNKISELEHNIRVLNCITDEDFSDDLKKLMDIRYHLSKFEKKIQKKESKS